MAGKVTIIVVAEHHTTKELEDECHEMIGYWFGGDYSHASFIVPSDDTEEQIKEEYLET